MLFLLGVKTHPIVRILTGAALLAIGLGLGFRLLAVPAVAMLAWGGYNWFRRARAEAWRAEVRAHKVRAHKNGAAR